MTDDIVTRLREGKGDDIVLFGMMYEAAVEIEGLRADRDRWRNLANRLGTHLGEGLYSEGEWECREYAIAAYSTWQYTDGAQLFEYEVEPQPVWWFREGKEV